jgi:hypothetical protein
VTSKKAHNYTHKKTQMYKKAQKRKAKTRN